MLKSIEERLCEVAESNRVSLSNLSLSSSRISSDTGSVNKGASHHLVSLALERSHVNSVMADSKCSVSVTLNPSERASVHNLILNEKGTSSCTLQSIIMLASVIEETHELVQIANKTFLPSISIFGKDLNDSLDVTPGNINTSKTTIYNDETRHRNQWLNESSAAQRDKELVKRMGKYLPDLQKVSNFCKRVNRLIQHLVWQSIALNSSSLNPEPNSQHSSDSASRNESCCAEMLLGRSSSVKYIIAEALSKLCRVLIELDYAVENNFTLKESWDLYTNCIFQKEEDNFEVASSTLSLGEMKGEHPIDVISVVYHSSPEVNDAKVDEDKDASEDIGDGDSDHHENNHQHDLMKLERMLVQLDNSILSSRSFLMAIDQSFYHSSLVTKCNVKRDSTIDEIVKEMIILLIDRFTSAPSGSGGNESQLQEQDLIGVYGLICLYRKLVPTSVAPDVKFYKTLLSDKVPVFIPIIGEVPFVPYDFLNKYEQSNKTMLLSSKPWDRIKKHHDKTFEKEVHELYMKHLKWFQNVESILSIREHKRFMKEHWLSYQNEGDDSDSKDDEHLTSQTREIISTLLDGVKIAKKATYLLRNHLLSRRNLAEPLDASDLDNIEKLCTIAKSVERTFKCSKQRAIIFVQRAGIKVLALELYKKLDRLRSYIDHHHSIVAEEGSHFIRRQYTTERIAISLGVVESLLKGSSSFSATRIATLRVAVSSCHEDHPDFSSKYNANSIEKTIHDLCMVADMDECVSQVCDCSFLFFHQNLFNPLIKNVCNSMRSSVQYVMFALQDPYYTILQTSKYMGVLYPMRYREFLVHDLIENHLVESLSCNIDSILRHRVISKYIDELPMLNPNKFAMNSLTRLLELKPFLVCGVSINVKKLIELSLERVVYNSSTIGHQDTRTHIEMSITARELGINLLDSMLPVGSLTNVVNVLDIANNIHTFVSEYNYDMIQQYFIQKATYESRHLLTAGIENVSVSLRQHGLGNCDRILNSILHYIPHEISKFITTLRSELFFSLLSREHRWFEDFKQTSVQPYQYKRAVALREAVLDTYSKSLEYPLKSCVSSITKIGNALGMCRLLNTTRRRIIMQSKQYDLEEENETFSNTNIFVSATKILDKCAAVQQVTDTLVVLHILYPIMCLQHLESSAQTRDMIRKKVKTANGHHMDDGFVLGVALLSEYFGQSQSIDGLNWTLSTKQHFEEEKKIIKSKIDASYQQESDSSNQYMFAFKDKAKGSTENRDENTRNQVLINRLEMQEQEMNMLQFKFYSFRTLCHNKQ